MSKIKKLIALTLALAMVLSVSAFAGSYKADTYADAASINSDCKSAIELLYVLDIMVGDGKNFNPESAVTRAEMAKMIYVILNYGDDDKAVTYTGAKFFTDVEAGYWAEGYINYCASTKLIAGRGDGTFDPTAPVTTAEAAKMLLTAIGYSAEARGYTGANWDKNVLSDAAILGLLDGYKSNVNLVAPRQWVAVMVANALDCLTFTTMAPSFDGLLVSGSNVDEDGRFDLYKTMGEKYYGYTVKTGVITSINGYAIDGTVVAGDGEIVIGGVKIEADATIEDLGQEFKAIYVVEDGDNVAISLRNTGKSVVAEDEVKDVTYELTYATSDNKYNNKYEFTIGDMTEKADTADGKINVLDVKAGNKTFEEMGSTKMKEEIAKGEYRNDIVRAIDADGKGDIEYVIYTPVEYAVVTKVATSQKYGDYFKADDIAGNALKINNGSNLYVEDCIISEDELEVDNIIKFTWNIDEGKYNVEVLPVIEAANFDSRKINKNEYTFDGETYNLAANAFVGVADELAKSKILDTDYDIVVDGDLLVYAIPTDGNYKSMDEVNANLAVLIMADNRNSDLDNTKQVKLLTIDGNVEWYAYDNAAAVENKGVKWADLFDTDYDEDEPTWDMLYIKHETDDGLWLEAISEGENEQMDTELFDKFTKADDKVLEVKDGKGKYEGNRVPADYKFFAYVDKEYTVITMADLENGKYELVDAEYALVDEGTYYDSIVGGYFRIGDAIVAEEGFLFVTEIYEKETADATTILALTNGSEEEIEIELSETSVEPLLYNCYYYEYDGDVYTLSKNWDKWTAFVADEDIELWYEKTAGEYASLDVTDWDIIALRTIEQLRNEADGNKNWEVISNTVEFVTAEELIARIEACEDMLAEDDLTYSFDYKFILEKKDSCDDDIIYVCIWENMVENQYEDEGDNEVLPQE
ncbi:MAG: S-layer homology domain-containing protein [Clostridia bacterium]|nr:S-layer homology domain-containing protein [Clostridia bacterium]